MDRIKGMYLECKELECSSPDITEADCRLQSYASSNIPNQEEEVFLDAMQEVLNIREEYYFKAGFKVAVELLAACI